MRKKKIDFYFGEKEEQAVIDYINSTSIEEKNKIYNDILIEPFRKMVQSILRKYPIHIGYYDVEEIEQNALTHLIEHMVIFDNNRTNKAGNKTKAYSYCQTIVRNYYIDHSVRSHKEKLNNLPFDEYYDESDERYVSDDYDSETDFLDVLIGKIINNITTYITKSNIKLNEKSVGIAIINILENWEVLFAENSIDGKYDKKITNKYAKNKVLLLIKEQTGLTTKEIRIAMKPFKEIYYFKKLEILNN